MPQTLVDPASWELWWQYNRWRFLDADRIGKRVSTTTAADGYFLGRGAILQPSPLLRASRIQLKEQVAPALAQVIEGERGIGLLSRSILARARVRGVEGDGGKDAGAPFAELARGLMRDGASPALVDHAVLALGIQGDQAALPVLVGLLRGNREGAAALGKTSVPERVRSFAAIALAILSDRTPDTALRRSVDWEFDRLFESARTDLKALMVLGMGRAGLPFDTQSGEAREGPRRTDGQSQLERLAAILADQGEGDRVRAMVPGAMARIAASAPEAVRLQLVSDLAGLIAPRKRLPTTVEVGVVQALGALCRSGPESDDADARTALMRLTGAASSQRIIRNLARIALADAAARLGKGDRPDSGRDGARRHLLTQLRRSRGQDLAWTALALAILEMDAPARGGMPDDDVTEGLRRAFDAYDSSPAGGALALSLGLIQDRESEDRLLKRLKRVNEESVLGYTALGVGLLGAPRGLMPLRTLLRDSAYKPFLLHQTALALAQFGDQETGPRLLAMLAKASDSRVQSAIASAMGWVRDPRTLGNLSERLLDERVGRDARGWTAVALGRTADADARPWNARLGVGLNYLVELPVLIERQQGTGALDQP